MKGEGGEKRQIKPQHNIYATIFLLLYLQAQESLYVSKKERLS